MRRILLACVVLGIWVAGGAPRPAEGADRGGPLLVDWADGLLTIHAPQAAGGDIHVRYLEAYCRAGSTDRDWAETVIPHQSRLVSSTSDGAQLELEDKLADGVVVRHKITGDAGEVRFSLIVHNPTAKSSEAAWAQPCIKVDTFTGHTQSDYIPQCFLLLEGKVTRMPTEPWATQARYTPGQVYCPQHVDRNDVNPRPLSKLVPSHGLIGCFSADAKWILASAWEPYQELFQGVAVCVHSDFRIGGLKPGETKQIRGKIYLTRESIVDLVQRYERDFPEHLAATSTGDADATD